MNLKRHTGCLRNVLLAATLVTTCATAQDAYPTKPLRFIAPFPPGGTTDVLSRVLAQKLSDRYPTFGRTTLCLCKPEKFA